MRGYLFFVVISFPLFSLPYGGVPIGGEAELHLSPAALEILASDRSIIEWSDFSIEAGETVRFIQPNTNASVLNRVMEAYPSRLMGNLEANGQVLLINPNGVLVGKDALIDVGSLIASTLDCKSFNSDIAFEGSSHETILNLGTIKGSNGDVLLIAGQVVNEGSIQASGLAGLIANSDVLFKPADTQRIYVRGRSFSDAFIHEATHRGSICAKNAYVLGQYVRLTENSKIDVSSSYGGGTVLIGGDFMGGNPHLENARFTWVEPSALILANATSVGNGGKVIVWSDESTQYYGHIEAMGGKESGDGGIVEVSGSYLDFQGTASTLAVLGKIGTLYLDPLDITISAGVSSSVMGLPNGPTYTPTGAGCINYLTSPPTAGTSVLNRGTLQAALGMSSIVIRTSGTAGLCPGDILFNQGGGISWAANTSLTLDAAHDIVILATIINTGAGANGDIILMANNQVRINDHTLLNPGPNFIVSVGSLNGHTTVNAPNAGLLLRGGNNTNQSYAQLGYPLNVVASPAATGPIDITCNTILLEAGAGQCCPALIGHGNPSNLSNTTANVNAPITIVTTGDIILRNQVGAVTGNANYNGIGHGGANFGAARNLSGNISINCGGALSLQFTDNGCVAVASCVNFSSYIGHKNAPVQSSLSSGNIDINCTGNVYLGYPTPVLAVVPTSNFIGHGSNNIVGDITVRSCGNITLDSSQLTNVGGGANYIGVDGTVAVVTLTSNVNTTVIAAGSVALTGGTAGATVRGFNVIGEVGLNGGTPSASLHTGDVRVIAGTSVNLSLNSSVTAPGGGMGIGVFNSNINSVSNTFVSAGTDIRIENFSSGLGNAGGCGITGVNDINVAAFNDIIVFARTTNVAGTSTYAFIGPSQYTPAATSTTRVFAVRDILCTNSGTFPDRATLARSHVAPTAVANVSLIARAGGDIQLASNLFATFGTAGDILIESDSAFVPGALITTAGGVVTTIDGRALAPAATLPGCMAALNSPFTLVDGFGAVRINKGAALVGGNIAALTIRTATSGMVIGDISIHSAALSRNSATPQDLTISNAANITFVNLVTTDGNIEISGSAGNNPLPDCADSFRDITINSVAAPTWTSGSIYVRADRNLAVNTLIHTSGANAPVTLISDNDLDGIGDINLSNSVTASGGNVSVNAGIQLNANNCMPLFSANIAPSASTASVNQNNAIVSTTGAGQILVQGAQNYSLTGAAGSISAQTGTVQLSFGNDIDVNGAAVSIATTSGSITLDAGRDIGIDKAVQSTLGGAIAMTALNDIDTSASISTTSGAITLIADADNSGFGNLTINANITSSAGGNICLAAGPGTFGCDQNNCNTGLISGFPVGNCTVEIASGTVSSTTGSITVTSADSIIVNGSSPSISTGGPIALTAGLGDLTVNQQIVSTGSSITTFAGNNTTLTQTLPNPTLINAADEIRMITGLNMTLNTDTAIASTGGRVTIVVDNIHPSVTNPPVPAANSGRLFMDERSSITSGPGQPLRLFTAYSQAFTAGPGVNFVDLDPALLNGANPSVFGYPGTVGANTAIEQWCTFFGCPNSYPFPDLGVPFTFFYKVCMPLLVQQAQIIVTQFFLELHPYNEFPGWMEEFWIGYLKPAAQNDSVRTSSLTELNNEPFYLRRRHLNVINHPKTWTAWFE